MRLLLHLPFTPECTTVWLPPHAIPLKGFSPTSSSSDVLSPDGTHTPEEQPDFIVLSTLCNYMLLVSTYITFIPLNKL